MNDNPKKEVKLYIKYVPISFSNDSLKKILSQFGTVLSVFIDIPAFKVTKFGYAFATVATSRDAVNIIENVHKKPPLNLFIELARDRNRNHCPVQEFLHKRDEMSSPNFFQFNQTNGMTNGELPNDHISSEVGNKSSPALSEASTSDTQKRTKFGKCLKCSKSATKRCSVCKVYYCSTNCQFDDWFEHQFKCRTPPPLEEAMSFEVCDDKLESKSLDTNSGTIHVKENEASTAGDERDSSYSFSRLLKGASVTSNEEVNSCTAERKEVGVSQNIEKRTEKVIPNNKNEERLGESSLKKVLPSNNMQYTENFVKNEPLKRNLTNLPPHANDKLEKEMSLTKPKKLLKKDIPTEKLQVGSEHNVFPTYLDGETLYVQLASDRKAAMIREMTVNMSHSCSTAPLPEILQLGEVVCTYISRHDTWYRGEVLEINTGRILVHIFDFGYEEMVHIKDVRVCDPKFKNFPVMAIPVKPIYNCSQETLRESLYSYIEESNPILMIVIEENPLKVELMDITGQIRIISDQIPQEVLPTIQQTNIENSKAVELLRSGEVKPSMPFYDECAFASLPIKDGVEIFILNPDNPMNVFAVPKESVVNLYQDLEVLSTEMNEYCNSLSTTYYEPQEGEICMARFSSDNLWYRAACIYQNKDSASVVFVDYGNQEEVSFKNICQMVDKFLAVPLIALHCRIKDFTPEEVFAGGSKLIEKFKALLPPNSSHVVNVVEKCDVSHVYVLEIPSLDMEGLKKGTLC